MASTWERAGFANEYAYRKARAQAATWTERHSRSERSRYSPSMSPEQFRAYHDAFSSKATGMASETQRARRRSAKRAGRHLGPSRYVRKYLIDSGMYSRDEFDEIYSGLS